MSPNLAYFVPYAGAEQVVRSGFEQGLFGPYCSTTGEYAPTKAHVLRADGSTEAVRDYKVSGVYTPTERFDLPSGMTPATVLLHAFDHAGRFGYDRNATREYTQNPPSEVPTDELQVAIDADHNACVEWLDGLLRDAECHEHLSSYTIALLAAWGMARLPESLRGLMCSAYPAFKAQQAKIEAASDTLEGVWFGTLGVRSDDVVVTVEKIVKLPPKDFGHGPKDSFLCVMREHSTGAKLKWFTGDNLDFDEGQIVLVRCTPKKHDSWEGRRETIVNRVKEVTP